MDSAPVSIDTQHDDMVRARARARARSRGRALTRAAPHPSLSRARAQIHDAQLDYYSRKLATASSDRTIKVWDVDGAQHALSASIAGHDGPVWEVAWAHPRYGVLLASCSYDSAALVHRESPPGTWAPVYQYRGHTASVNSVAWAPHEHGLVLACASSDGKVSIHAHQDDDSWAVSLIHDSTLGCLSVSWAPFAAAGGADGAGGAAPMRLVTGSCENMVRARGSPGRGRRG